MIEPRTFEAWGIVNRYGALWCNKSFVTIEDATEFVGNNLVDNFSIVPVVVTIQVKAKPAVQEKPRKFMKGKR